MPHPDPGTTRTQSPRRQRSTRPGVPAPHRRLTVLLTAGAYLLITLDALVVVTALPSIHADLGGGAGNLPWIINAYALTFAAGIITAAALGDRLGQETHVRRRAAAVQPRLGRVRAGAQPRHPDRLPGHPGPRRRDRHASGPDPPHVVLPGRAPRRGRRDLGRGRRPRCRVRTSGRRRGHRGPRLALDLLGERAARHRRRRGCPPRPARDVRSADADSTRSAWSRPRVRWGRWCGACSALRTPGGDPPRCWSRSSSASSSWPGSWPGSPSRRRRWCRCRCSARGCSRPRRSPSS